MILLLNTCLGTCIPTSLIITRLPWKENGRDWTKGAFVNPADATGGTWNLLQVKHTPKSTLPRGEKPNVTSAQHERATPATSPRTTKFLAHAPRKMTETPFPFSDYNQGRVWMPWKKFHEKFSTLWPLIRSIK